MAVTGTRHGHHVALRGWFSFNETHSSETLSALALGNANAILKGNLAF